MKDLCRKETVQIISKIILKFLAVQGSVRRGAGKYLCFKPRHGQSRFGKLATRDKRTLDIVEKRVTQRTRHRMFRHGFECRGLKSLVEIIRQRLFKPRTVN